MTLALVTLATFAASVIAVRAFLVVSRRRLVDAPGARSSHATPTPTGGGFPAVTVWLAATAIAATAGASTTTWGVAAAGAALLAAVGLADDAWDLPRIARYGAHLIVGVIVVWAIGHLSWPVELPAAVRAAASVIAVTALINLWNFMDGIDGLVGGSGAIVLAWVASWTGDTMWWLAVAAYLGFVVHNLPPARIFMGDAGSTTLGGLVGVAFVTGDPRLDAAHAVVLVPIVGDAVYTLTRRALRRENIFRAHHSHLYQRLLRAGHRHGSISAGYAVATALCGAAATWARPWGPPLAAATCVVAVIAIELHVARRGVPFTRPAPDASPVPTPP